MKRFVSILTLASLCVTAFSGCAAFAGSKAALKVGEAEVDSRVFAYFYDEAYGEAEADGGDTDDEQALKQAATEKCYEYVIATTTFQKLSLSLDVNEKKAVADETEEQWHLYGDYYTEIGVNKQTVAKINLADAYRTSLLLYYFGKGSEYEVPESEIEYYFDQTYVAFRAINGYLTTTDENGNTVAVSAEEEKALRADFEAKRASLAEGSSFAEVNGGTEVDINFVQVSSSAYPKDFLAQVEKLEYDKPAVIETEENIFLVVRADAKKGEDNFYADYRTRYIDALRGEMLTDMLVATAEDYELEANSRVEGKAAKTVTNARNSRNN